MKVRLTAQVTVTKDKLAILAKALAAASGRRVLIGFPRATATREQGSEVNNAELGYIHNYGAPEQNIPQREFMDPAFKSVLDKNISTLGAGLKAMLAPGTTNALEALDRYLHKVGLQTQAAIKATIRAGLDPELAESTVRARIARRKSKPWKTKRTAAVDANIAAGLAPGAGLFTPLIDTSRMLNAVTYVIRRPHSDTDVIVGPTSGGLIP